MAKCNHTAPNEKGCCMKCGTKLLSHWPQLEDYGLYRIHAKEVCKPPCPFHAPSDHPLNQAPIHIRDDKDFLVERICEHGVGHDDPDSASYMRSKGLKWPGIHGCDGCCTASPSQVPDLTT